MILVAFLRVMPGTTFLSTMTTRGIELFQSLWRSTFHGSSGLALVPVRLRSAFLGFVAGILRTLWHSLEKSASPWKASFHSTPRTKPDERLGFYPSTSMCILERIHNEPFHDPLYCPHTANAF